MDGCKFRLLRSVIKLASTDLDHMCQKTMYFAFYFSEMDATSIADDIVSLHWQLSAFFVLLHAVLFCCCFFSVCGRCRFCSHAAPACFREPNDVLLTVHIRSRNASSPALPVLKQCCGVCKDVMIMFVISGFVPRKHLMGHEIHVGNDSERFL